MSKTTRKELERALVETAWGFFHKGEKVQYCGRPFNDTFPKWYGGAHRPPAYSTIEDATSQKALFTVCSDFCYSVYDNALKMPLLGGRLNYTTGAAWRCSAAPKEFAVIRWIASNYNDGKGTYSEADKDWGISQKPVTLDELIAFLKDWEHNLRPGDIFDVFAGPGGGHNLLYIGGGYILDSVGKSYDSSSGMEKHEERGSVRTLRTVEEMFTNEVAKWNVRDYEANGTPSFFCVLRPLDLIVKAGVLDTEFVMPNAGYFHHDPNLPRTGFCITPAAAARVKYPGIEVDKTASVPVYASAEAGGTVTYFVKVTNHSNNGSYVKFRSDVDGKAYVGEDYSEIKIIEIVPDGTEFVSASHGASVCGNEIQWTVDVPAGESVTVSFTTKVTAKRGSCIFSKGGSVAGIPSTALCNVVSGSVLSTDEIDKLKKFSDNDAAFWNSNEGYRISANDCDTKFAQNIYRSVLGKNLSLPDTQTILDELFFVKELEFSCGFGETYNKPLKTALCALKEKTSSKFQRVRDMVIRGYLGGRYVYTDKFGMEPRINEFRAEDLQPGDIVIHGTLSHDPAKTGKISVAETNVIVCVEAGKYAALNSQGEMLRLEGTNVLWKAFIHDFFIGLRPCQAYDDICAELEPFDPCAMPLLTDADKSRAKDPWSGECMKRCFARIAPDSWQMARFPISQRSFALWIYSVAGFDISEKMPRNIDEGLLPDDPMILDSDKDLRIGDLLCRYKLVDEKKHFASSVKIDDDKFFCVKGISKVGQSNECHFLTEDETKSWLNETSWDIISVLRPSKAYELN